MSALGGAEAVFQVSATRPPNGIAALIAVAPRNTEEPDRLLPAFLRAEVVLGTRVIFAGRGEGITPRAAAWYFVLADRAMTHLLVMRLAAFRRVAIEVCAAGPAAECWQRLAANAA